MSAVLKEDAELKKLTRLMADLEHSLSINKLSYYKPYPYQIRFHNSRGQGTDKPASQRLLMAANKIGKTYCTAMETAYHATGQYPDWWEGTRFTTPVEMLVSGMTNDSVRDIGQRELLGNPTDIHSLGKGTIPKKSIGKLRTKVGVPNAYDSVRVKHVTGGESTIYFRAYEQGWKKFQGIKFSAIWPDEEPPAEIWSQLIRATLTNQQAIIYCSMTPEEGMTEIVTQFMENLQIGQALITATWDDAPHFSEEEKEQRLAALRPHEREMRSKGIPLRGAGLVFPVPDDNLLVEPFPIPKHWPQIVGIDFGISTQHPFSAARWAWDRDNDIKYLIAEFQTSNDLPAAHIDAINTWGKWIPVSWPHDGANREKGTGDELQQTYRKKGLNLLPWKATNPPTVGQKEGEGGNSVEASILSMLDDMYQGRIKVFRTCPTFFREKALYHRDLKGKIVKMHEDLICAARYGHMMIRHARVISIRPPVQKLPSGIRQW
jgi:phage terminase large subunit-like protein